jgi:predicted transcriptional regulator
MQDEVGEEQKTKVAEEVVPEVVETLPEPAPEVVSEPIPEPAPPPTPEPVAEPVPIIEEPTATPTLEETATEATPALEPETLPVVVPTPPVVVEPVIEPEPEKAPVSTPEPTPEQPKEEPVIVTPPPVLESPKDTGGIPQKVLDLTPEELDAARRLWATQNIKSVQAKSAHDRTARRDALLREIERYIKSNPPATLSMIAYHANISPRKASDYLRILVKSKRIKATGATTSRRYS